MPDSPYPLLFSPFDVGPMRLRNRIVHASMSTRYVKQREVTDKLITYHRTRAVGGAAMIVTEPLGMLPHQLMAFRPALFDQENLVIPGADIGTVLVYKIFDRLSYGVILTSTEPAELFDEVVGP